jgi:MFS family permease
VADAKMNRLDGPARKRVFGDWKIYCGVVMYIGIVNTGYATSFFTPTIIRDLGFTAEAAQIRSIPVFVVAAVVSLVVAWCADRARHRFGFCILGICMASVGYVILLCQDSVSVGVRYFAIFVVVSGGYICQPVTLAWIQNNMTGHYKRSIASAMMVGFGNCGGIVASNIFITEEAPHYMTGYATSLGLLWMCAAACVVLLLGVRVENKKRDRGERDWRLDTADADNLGDDHPHFRFTY